MKAEEIAEQARKTKRQHKQVIEREQAWHRNNNKRMRLEASKRETEKYKDKTTRRQCKTVWLEQARQLPQKQQQEAQERKQQQLQLLKLREIK